jgi:hypothetical protein
MSGYQESFMVMKEVAPGASLMDGKQITQPCLSTGSETGNASEKPNGSPCRRKAGLLPAFFLILNSIVNYQMLVSVEPFVLTES